MSGDDETGDELARYSRSEHAVTPSDQNEKSVERAAESNDSVRSSQTSSPAHSGEKSTAAAETINELASSIPGEPTTVETESITATLIGIPRVDIRKFVYDHHLDHTAEETRPIALFDLQNTGKAPLRWQSTRTKFIGDDNYTYQPATLSLDPVRLGPGCHTRQVEIEPDRRARVVTLVEALPTGVEVEEVIHTLVPPGRGPDQRLAFSVK